MSDGCCAEVPRGLSWREATYQFGPLRNALAAGLLLGLGLLLEAFEAPEALAIAVFLAAIPVGAWYFAQEGWEELVEEREVGIEALMLLAAAGALVFGLFEEAAALIFLYALAEAIEELTFARTRSAIRELLDLAPPQATMLDPAGGERVVAAEQLRPGDVFLVKPGESLPTDGVIRDGSSALNEAPVTGESVPVEKGPGAEVFAGTLNGSAALEVEATKPYAENTLQRIVQLVEEAQAQKSRAQRFVDRFSTRYSPAVLVAAVLVALLPPLFGGDWEDWALRAVTLLVAGAPCALVMSVPVAAAAAITRAGREGILIKGGLQLEALGRIEAICFDKTGTLTRGKPEVTDVIPTTGSREEALALTAAVEARSEHPLARAVLEYVRDAGIAVPPAENAEALVGLGARATVGGRRVWVGSPELFAEIAPRADLPEEVERLQDEGKTVILAASQGTLLATIGIRDEPRPEAQAALEQLRRLGVRHVAMLTGDNERTARAIADELGIDHVRAGLKPDDKVAAVAALRAEHGAIAMVGDGINDAPALATADLGMAMGTGGTDAAIEAADVALMADDLTRVGEALRLGRRATRISRQNLLFSVALLTVLIPSAVVGLLTVVIAVAVHEVAELLAVANGARAARRSRRVVALAPASA